MTKIDIGIRLPPKSSRIWDSLYRITQDQKSDIVNDPNGWFDDPRDLIAAIRRIVHISVETARIGSALPEPIAELRDASRNVWELYT